MLNKGILNFLIEIATIGIMIHLNPEVPEFIVFSLSIIYFRLYDIAVALMEKNKNVANQTE